MTAIARGMDVANQFAVAKIQKDHMTGKGPFPPDAHRLGVVTSRLRSSVFESGTQEIGSGKLQSAIGSNVVYAAIHEFGGRIYHPARAMKIRHRVDARGNLVKQLGNSNLLMFARANHKRARETTVQGKAYDVEMPERAPFRTGLAESRPVYKEQISKAITDEWGKMGA
jgi:phage gpG-like protein